MEERERESIAARAVAYGTYVIDDDAASTVPEIPLLHAQEQKNASSRYNAHYYSSSEDEFFSEAEEGRCDETRVLKERNALLSRVTRRPPLLVFTAVVLLVGLVAVVGRSAYRSYYVSQSGWMYRRYKVWGKGGGHKYLYK